MKVGGLELLRNPTSQPPSSDRSLRLIRVTAREDEESRDLWRGHENSRTSCESKTYWEAFSSRLPTGDVVSFAISLHVVACQ